MTEASDQQSAQSLLQPVLTRHGVITPVSKWELRPVAAGSTRKEIWQRRHFQVVTDEHIACHLVAGKNLAQEFHRALEFHVACPKLSCRPLFHHGDIGTTEWIGFEHFPGTSLDERIIGGTLNATDWLSAIRRVQEALEVTRRPSSLDALTAEVSAVIKESLALSCFTEADRHLLRECGTTILLEGGPTDRISLRLTNGDFTARNILMDDSGEVRLIDHEFACWSHFGAADWLRFERFSHLPEKAGALLQDELAAARRPANELYLCLQHFLQLQRIEPAELGAEQYAKACQRLLHALAPASILINAAATVHRRTESVLVERTAWAGSLENELARARTALADKDRDLAVRTAWASSLDEQLRNAQINHANLSVEAEHRLTWAKSLEQELQTAKDHFAGLQKDHQRQQAWALALDAELNETRLVVAKLQQDFAERTAWALDLEKEVQAIRRERDRLTEESSRLVISGLLAEVERLKLAGECRAVDQNRATQEERATALESERIRLQADLATAQQRLDALLQELAPRSANEPAQ